MQRARHRILPATLVLAALAGSARGAAPVIFSPGIGMVNTTGDQQIQLFVAGTDQIVGENLNIQINTGTSGPTFTGVDILTASIFAADNTGQNGSGIISGSTSFAGRVITLTTTTSPVTNGTVLDNGLLLTLTINTNGQTSGTFDINVLGTPNGNTNFLQTNTAGNVTTLVPLFPGNTFTIGGTAWATNGGGAWNSSANWAAAVPGIAGDWANFLGSATSGTAVVTLDGSRTVGTLIFNNSSASYTIAQGTGGSLVMDNGTGTPTITNGRGNHAITAPITFTKSTNVIVAGGAMLTLGGAISGAGFDLNVSGLGTLVLSGANNYANTAIAGGAVLQMGIGAAAGTLGLGPVADAGTLVINRSDVLTVGNIISGVGALAMAGGGTVTLSSANTYSGTTTILAGAINVASSAGLANSTLVYNQAGGTLLLNVASLDLGGVSGNKVLSLGATTLNIGGSNSSSTFSGGFSGTGAVHKVGAGAFQLSAATSTGYTGTLFLDAGSLVLGNGVALGAGPLVVNGGTLLFGDAAAAFNGSNNFIFNTNSAMHRAGTGATDSMSGNWTGTNRVITLALPVSEILALNGTSGQFTGFSGTLALGTSNGSLRLGGLAGATPTDVGMGTVFLDVGTGTVASGSGGIQTIGALNGTSSASLLSGLAGIATSSTLTPLTTYVLDGLNINTTFAGNITNGTGPNALTALNKIGTATLTLTGNSKTYSGGTTISGGLLVASSNQLASTSVLGAGPVILGAPGVRLQFSGNAGTANTAQSVANITSPGGTASNATLGAVAVDATVNLTSGAVRAGSLTVDGTHAIATNSPFSKVTSLSIAHTGVGSSAVYTSTLQLNNNRLVLQTADAPSKAAAITSINEALFSGKGTAGTWTGTKGITSSSAAGNTAQLTVAVYDNANLRDLVNTANPRTNWAGGIGNVDANSLLVTTALKGDVNLDGIVNISDLILIAAHFNEFGQSNGISTLDMSHGDVNQDGIVNVSDLILTAGNFNSTSNFNVTAAIAVGLDVPVLPLAVPEPATLVMLLAVGAGMLTSWRPRR